MTEFYEVDPASYAKARARSRYQHVFSPFSSAEARADPRARAFLSMDGTCGFLVVGGDLRGLFNAGRRGRGRDAVRFAVESAGARTLDCFDGFLPSYYASLGFVETGRAPFDPTLAPALWDAEAHGTPDVIFMHYLGS